MRIDKERQAPIFDKIWHERQNSRKFPELYSTRFRTDNGSAKHFACPCIMACFHKRDQPIFMNNKNNTRNTHLNIMPGTSKVSSKRLMVKDKGDKEGLRRLGWEVQNRNWRYIVDRRKKPSHSSLFNCNWTNAVIGTSALSASTQGLTDMIKWFSSIFYSNQKKKKSIL